MDKKKIARAIRRAVEDSDSNLTKLAEEIGCTIQSVSRCLSDPTKFPNVRREIIAKFDGVDPWETLNRDPHAQLTPPTMAASAAE